MEREWKRFVTQKELVGVMIVVVKSSDIVLEEEDWIPEEKDWPVHVLKFHENGICIQQTVENKGIYKMDNFVGKNLNDLTKWSNWNSTGHYGEISHDLCILIYF